MTKQRKEDSSEKGFTLVEVLVALTIFAIGLLALASMQVTSLRGNANSQELTAATALAEGTLEWLLAMSPRDDVFETNMTDYAEIDEIGGASPVAVDGAGTLRAFYRVDTTPSASATFPGNVVRVDVRVDLSRGRQITIGGLKRVED